MTDDNGVMLERITYGDDNRRLARENGDPDLPSYVMTYYAWGGDRVLAEYTETFAARIALAWTKSYVYLGERLLATLAQSGAGELVHYHHPDRLGTRLITNGVDTSVTEQEPFAFGVEEGVVPARGNTRRFTSYDRSAATGLDYAVNRHYDPQQGRFTQVDPLGMGAAGLSNPQSLNMFAYVQNDPVNTTDALGLKFAVEKHWVACVEISRVYPTPDGETVEITCQPGTGQYQYVTTWIPDPTPGPDPTPPGEGGGGGGGVGAVEGTSTQNASCGTDDMAGRIVLDTLSNVSNGFADKITSWWGTSFFFGYGPLIGLLTDTGSQNELVRELSGNDPFVNEHATSYTVGEVTGYVWEGIFGGLRIGAEVGGSRFGHFLNHNKYLRLGPGRMQANGPFPFDTHAPRLSIGPQTPGRSNPHIDLRARCIDY